MKQWDSVCQNPRLFLWKGKIKMKKLIASILAVCMVLTSMCVVVSAETTVKTDRELNVVVDKTEVYAVDGKDIVKVSVVLKDNRTNVADDDHFIGAEYTLNYDHTLFELQETNIEGHKIENGQASIYEVFFKTTNEGYNSGDVLATYTFKAIPQVEEETDTFYLTTPEVYTLRECIPTEVLVATTESKNVTIKLEPYEVKKYIDGNEVFDSADDSLPDNSFPYDNAEHKFRVETVPSATVAYTVKLNGEEITPTFDIDDNVVIKGEGRYEISYEVTNKADGYDEVKGTYTIEIQEPIHFIEVVPNYVFANDIGKMLVLVYTSTEGAVYKYNGNVMVDVSESGYKYDDAATAVDEKGDYDYVYAFVTDPISGGSENNFKAYKDLVSHVYNYSGEIPAVGEYNTDINFSGHLNVQDISFVYGVVNAFPAYFADVNNQKYILKADVSGDKHVKGNDASSVVSAVKAAHK